MYLSLYKINVFVTLEADVYHIITFNYLPFTNQREKLVTNKVLMYKVFRMYRIYVLVFNASN